jgi:malonyl CoA-acyl carrier protein transacylase/4'-phosphopantetheinyl transferase EntD
MTDRNAGVASYAVSRERIAVTALRCNFVDAGDIYDFWTATLNPFHVPVPERTAFSDLCEEALAETFPSGGRRAALILCENTEQTAPDMCMVGAPLSVARALTFPAAMETAFSLLSEKHFDAVLVGVQDLFGGNCAVVALALPRTAADAGAHIYALLESVLTAPAHQHHFSNDYLDAVLDAHLGWKQTEVELKQFRDLDAEQFDTNLDCFKSFVKACLALSSKILPANEHAGGSRTRPWINPAFVKTHPRRSLLCVQEPEQTRIVCLQEHITSVETPRTLFHWDSEILVFSAESRLELCAKLQGIIPALNGGEALLRDIAFTVNDFYKSQASSGQHRLAIVASSVDDLISKLEQAAELIENLEGGRLAQSQSGIYYCEPDSVIEGKLAFVLPGLGSAYRGMLSELCLAFPEVRFVFDFVDFLATECGDTQSPSRTIFPEEVADGSLNSASIAASDSAVVAVLMAEYALNTLLNKLGVEADVFMGCSTGEFAALTMCGAIDVLKAAKSFYQLSTDVARSVPAESLSALRSTRVFSSWEQVKEIISQVEEPVYLSADLGSDHLILSGTESGIETAISLLRSHGTMTQMLPLAIPYHTPLVDKLLHHEDEEIQSIEMKPLDIPGWSCSLAAPYPSDVHSLRRLTTQLFSRPVRLRETIEAMYADGVRLFVEVGPNGVLTAMTQDLLSGREHVAVAANLSSRSSLLQIQHLLALLFTHRVEADFAYLFAGRPAKLLTDLTAAMHAIAAGAADLGGCKSGLVEACGSMEAGASEQLVAGFFQTTRQFYEKVTQAQQQVVAAYLQQQQTSDSPNGVASQFPFVRNADQTWCDDGVELRFALDLNEHRFLRDHAIGGIVSQTEQSRVFLLPLMVGLEIMAEAASVLDGRFVERLEEIKAYRRVQVMQAAVPLVVRVQPKPEKIHVAVYEDAGENEDALLMECHVRFCDRLPDSPVMSLQADSEPLNNLSNDNLYGAGGMFHGPMMQAVRKLSRLDERRLQGLLSATEAQGWFATEKGQADESHADDGQADGPEPLIVHPLLLDNASQLVLFNLFELDENVTALLPFFIDSIEFFSAFNNTYDNVFVRSRLTGLNARGTEAELVGFDDQKQVLFRVNSINSRRISLSEQWRRFVDEPVKSVSKRLATPYDDLEIRLMSDENLPEEETTLDWCADYYLTEREKNYWRSQCRSNQRRREWFLGRICAKDAIRSLIVDRLGIILGPLDVEVLSEDRKPLVVIHHPDVENKSTVSISHSDGTACAIASIERTCGIDIERIRPRDKDLSSLVNNESESAFIESGERDVEFTRLWAAKEALCKVHGGSVRDYETSKRISSADGVTINLRKVSGSGDFTVDTHELDGFMLAIALPIHAVR